MATGPTRTLIFAGEAIALTGSIHHDPKAGLALAFFCTVGIDSHPARHHTRPAHGLRWTCTKEVVLVSPAESPPPPTTFVALLFPNVTQLDLTGPVQIFSRLPGASIHLAWAGLDPVPTDAGFSIVPTTTFDDAPQADILMVPGGQGAFDLLDDDTALDFVRNQAAGARYVTSVCTGAFVLAAAGLLVGRRATTHWASHPMLGLLGVEPVHERVVRDGNIFTGGGVTSGIDFALTVAEEVAGRAAATRAQLAIEYDPRPPFAAGSPSGADADPADVQAIRDSAWRTREPVVRRAAARLGIAARQSAEGN